MEALRNRLSPFAPVLLRYGLGFVFLWFSFSQFQDPLRWTGFLPDFVKGLGIAPVHFVQLNALVELVGGILLLLGAFTELTAFILALHMFGISFSIGMTAVGVRDIGLSVATLALAFFGAGRFAIDTLNSPTPRTSETVVS